jgi:hypothetical protein
MNAHVPDPNALQEICASCHLAQTPGERYPSDAKALIEQLARLRDRLAGLEIGAARVRDDATRRRLWAQLDRATDRTRQAVGAMHGFDLTATASLLNLVRADLLSIEAAVSKSSAAANPTNR